MSGVAEVFRRAELERLSACLARLLPSVHRDDVAVAGGVAIQIGMAELGLAGGRNKIADLDLVASSLGAVSPRVTDAFLVSHYHVVQPGVPKFMMQLVDPETRIRVDVFPDLTGSLSRSRVVRIGEQDVRVLALEDVFDHKLLTLSRASPGKPVDPKHADDAHALGKLLGRAVPAIGNESLVEDVYGGEAEFHCQRCDLSSSAQFPLAPKEQILSLLGWATEMAAH